MRYRLTLALLMTLPFGIAATPRSLLADEPFEDVTATVGLKGLSGGVASWGDYDNDGWVDLYAGGQLWRNIEGKRFVRVKASLGGPGIWGDYDNDGFLDLFCYQGGGRLYRNLRGKGFELAKGAIPKLPTTVSLGACWGDFNGDGYLDLYVGGYEVWPAKEYPDVILFNRGGKKFVEVWRQKRVLRARGVTAADFDEDGDLDIYVSNYRLQPNLLLQNDGKGRFRDVATALGVAGDGGLGAWGHTIGSCFGDLDNDGHLDLFVGNFSHPPAYQDRPKFYKNLGPKAKWRFQDMTAKAGLHWQESYASPTLGDFDNDGYLDLFFTTVYPGDRSVLYRNLGNWRFENVSAKAKVNMPTTYQGAWADYDGDGYLDLVTGGKLFRNPGGKRHWLRVRLVVPPDTPRIPRTPFGGQVRLKIGKQTLTRQVEPATGQGNQNDQAMHFGLGDHSGPVEIEIRWPGGGRQRMRTTVDRTVVVTFRKDS